MTRKTAVWSLTLALALWAMAPAAARAQEEPDTTAVEEPDSTAAEAPDSTAAEAAPADSVEQAVPGTQEDEASTPQVRPVVRAAVVTEDFGRAFKLDGILSEREWANADSIANLTQVEPEEGEVPEFRTIVRVLASHSDLFIGIRCEDSEPSGIVAFSKARDVELDEEDHVLIVLDTFGDERSGFVFAINPNGSRFDGIVTAQGDDVNSSWDAIWQGVAMRDDRGWSAELRLPVKSLSFKRGLTNWGMNVERRVQRFQETDRWSGAKLDFEIFQTSQAGIVADLPAFDQGVGLTVRPGVVGNANRPLPDAATSYNRDLNLDINQKLGSNLAAIVTLNTDFGETESDVRQVNLSRFEVLFPEKRTFFVEGADIFEFGLGTDLESATILPFFSRTIGLYTPEGEDEGTEIPLRGGGKLQGRIGNTNVGALMAATDQVPEFGVPKAEMGVARIRQNVFAESQLGMIATVGDPLSRPDSWTGGADFTYRTSSFREDKNLAVGVWGVTTNRQGLEGDKLAYGGKIAYPNDLLDMGLTYFRAGEEFQPSLGFVHRTGQVADVLADVIGRPGWPLVRQFTFGAAYFRGMDIDGVWESYSGSIRPVDVLFESGDKIEASVASEGERPDEAFDVFDSGDLTVEIPAGTYHWNRYTVLGLLAPKRRISGEVAYSFGGFYDGDLQTVEATLVLKPVDMLTFQLATERNMATLPEDEFTQYLYSARTELKITPDFQVTSFLQYDNESRSLGSAGRLRWTFNPLGDLWVAYNRNMTRQLEGGAGRWMRESDQFLVKVQYSWRL